MAGVTNGGHVLREGLEAVAGNEPCRLDVVLLEYLQKTLGANRAGEDAYPKVNWL